MPDHVHLLVAGSSDSRLSEFMRIFKQLSSYEAKRTTGEGLWQISYYDHVLRREEDLAQLARYIWENPVRAGLVSKRSDYPHSGPVPLMDG